MLYIGIDIRNSEGMILKFSELCDILFEVMKIKESVMYWEVFYFI